MRPEDFRLPAFTVQPEESTPQERKERTVGAFKAVAEAMKRKPPKPRKPRGNNRKP